MPNKSVSELEGAALDYAVAMALGHGNIVYKDGKCYSFDPITEWWGEREFSSEWDHGGQIIEQNGISLMHRLGKDGGCSSYYHAQVGPEEPENTTLMTHEKPLVAAMCSFVASKFGEYVEIP